MKTKVRPGVPFSEAAETARAKKSGAGPVDYTECARVFQATFTDLYTMFAPKGTVPPAITARNTAEWNPLVIEFGWTDAAGEVDIARRDLVTSYLAQLAVYAPPNAVCDSTGRTGGSLTFPRPEDALELLTRMTLARNSHVYDRMHGFGPRAGAAALPFMPPSALQVAQLDDIDLTPAALGAHMELVAKAAAQGRASEAEAGPGVQRDPNKSLLRFMPTRAYTDSGTAFAYAVQAREVHKDDKAHVIHLDYLRGLIARARGQTPPGSALLLQ